MVENGIGVISTFKRSENQKTKTESETKKPSDEVKTGKRSRINRCHKHLQTKWDPTFKRIANKKTKSDFVVPCKKLIQWIPLQLQLLLKLDFSVKGNLLYRNGVEQLNAYLKICLADGIFDETWPSKLKKTIFGVVVRSALYLHEEVSNAAGVCELLWIIHNKLLGA